MLEKMSASQLTATTESDQFSFHIRLLTPFRSGEVRRTLAAINSKTFEQLHCDPTHFRQFAEAVFFFENAKFLHLHFTKQTAINSPHDLGGDHRSPIFTWKRSRGTREILPCTRCFDVQQLHEVLILVSILQVGFGVTDTCRSNAADHAQGSAQLESRRGASRAMLPGAVAFPRHRARKNRQCHRLHDKMRRRW